jgi:hypothetical protein
MKRILGYVLLIVSGLIAYQSYLNAQPSPEVEAMAKGTACASAEGCEVKGDRPNVIQTSVVARRYQFLTSGGPVVVSCDREYLWFGEWSCAGAPGELAY